MIFNRYAGTGISINILVSALVFYFVYRIKKYHDFGLKNKMIFDIVFMVMYCLCSVKSEQEISKPDVTHLA